MRGSKIAWLAFTSVAIVFLYLLGIFVRGQYGIAISIHNLSGETVRGVTLKLEPHGPGYQLGVLPNGGRARAFVQPRTESHVVLQYADDAGTHTETVVGYVENGYCGKADVSIFPGHKVKSSENIDPVFCKKSWLDFM